MMSCSTDIRINVLPSLNLIWVCQKVIISMRSALIHKQNCSSKFTAPESSVVFLVIQTLKLQLTSILKKQWWSIQHWWLWSWVGLDINIYHMPSLPHILPWLHLTSKSVDCSCCHTGILTCGIKSKNACSECLQAQSYKSGLKLLT